MSWFLGILFFILACGAFACICFENLTAKILGAIGGTIFT